MLVGVNSMGSRLVVLFVWLIALPVYADPEVQVAFKAGPNTATLARDYRVNRYGYAGGVMGHLQWPVSSRLSLGAQVELLYTSRGAEVVFEGESQGKLRQRYFDAMVALRPEVQLGWGSIYLLLGGGPNFLISADDEDTSGMSQDVTNELRRIDVALLVGAGIALHLPQREVGPFHLGTFFLEVRHDRGLIDIDLMDGGFENRTSSLMIGLSLSLTSKTTAPLSTSSPARGDLLSPATRL